MESESTRLLRQWWNEPGDYSWVAEFLGPRGYLAGARVLIGTGGILMGLSLLCLMAEHLVEPAVVSHAVVVVMAVAAFAWAAYWWFLPWPPAAVSMILFAVTDVGIAVATAVHANPLGALSTTPLFAMTGAFIVFFFGPRVNAVHVVFATATIVATSVWLALSDQVGLAGFLSGVIAPSRDMMVREAAPAGAAGRAFGIVSTGFNIGGIISPLLFGWIMDQNMTHWVFGASAIFMVLTVVLGLITDRPRQSPAGATLAHS